MKTAADIAARAVCMGVVCFRARFEEIRFAAGAGETPASEAPGGGPGGPGS